GRSLWLGEPLSIPLHRLANGAFLLFSFFMISDPKTTPDSRAGRLLFSAIVAFGAAYVQLRLFRTNGLLWAPAAASPLVPMLDRVLPATRYAWPRQPLTQHIFWRKPIMRFTGLTLAVLLSLSAGVGRAEAFCGFYVSRADGKLFNKASHVVLVRDGDRTVI